MFHDFTVLCMYSVCHPRDVINANNGRRRRHRRHHHRHRHRHHHHHHHHHHRRHRHHHHHHKRFISSLGGPSIPIIRKLSINR